MKIPLLLFILFGLSLCSPPQPASLREHSIKDAFTVSPKEPAFGVEFTLDHLISSVTLGNKATYGLARVPGGRAYQSLMRRYLQFCFDVKGTEAPQVEELQRDWETGRKEQQDRRRRLTRSREFSWWAYSQAIFRRPEYSPEVFDNDEYNDDIDTAILSEAVGMLKSATVHELSRQLNITESSPWAYVQFVAPDFFWTTTKPKPDLDMEPDGIVRWNYSFDHDAAWYRLLTRKFSLALYRNKFRLSASSYWRDILDSSTSVFYSYPASASIMSYTRYHHCASVSGDTNASMALCGSKALSQVSMVFNYDNATSSLWLEGSLADWTPWSTFPDLGGHNVESQISEPFNSSLHLNRVLSKIDDLSDNIRSSARVDVDLILNGEFWTVESVAALQQRFDNDRQDRKFTIKNILHQPDSFAASKKVARSGRYQLETWDVCYQLLDPREDRDPDEL